MGCRSPSGDVHTLLPLYVTGGPGSRTLRFVGDGPGDQLGPICAPQDTVPAARALRQELPRGPVLGSLRGRAPAGRPGLEHPPRHRKHDSGGEPGRGYPDSRLGRVPRRPFVRVETAGRAARNAGSNGTTGFATGSRTTRSGSTWTSTSCADSTSNAGATRPRPSAKSAGPSSASSRTPPSSAVGCGSGSSSSDGQAAAAWLGFRFGDVESYYQLGRDPEFEQLSVGAVLIAHTLREAITDGMSEYRFLRGGEAFKFRWATRDPGVETVRLAGSAAGRATLAGAGLRRTAGRVRRALPGR